MNSHLEVILEQAVADFRALLFDPAAHIEEAVAATLADATQQGGKAKFRIGAAVLLNFEDKAAVVTISHARKNKRGRTSQIADEAQEELEFEPKGEGEGAAADATGDETAVAVMVRQKVLRRRGQILAASNVGKGTA